MTGMPQFLFATLSKGGEMPMPLDACGWRRRAGVSWRLGLA